ncbi:pathogenesis-related protein 5-like [Chenopodium quinoa]|uniref:pathogenesis-related protein 5-like n=1 Tax=Chenopodium quinoa TaxID=63459 RepID=UPI000B790C3D|nr:pathogenesis-related protein 5-like [Chenopodium quinoa]
MGAINWSFAFVLVSLFFLGVSTNRVSGTIFTLLNTCPYTVWPGTLSGNGPALLGEGSLTLSPGSTIQVNPPAGWSGRFWARTGCNFDASGAGNCSTGDCGGLQCIGGGAPPVSLVEFTLNGADGQDFYDVSLVDGYNVGVGVKPTSTGTGKCQYAGCVDDLNASCPPELQVTVGGAVVACKSACAAFNTPEYCCTGNHGSPQTCAPTHYSEMFKNACPTAYSYAYDDASSTCTCTCSDYLITFCPSTV